MVRPSSWPRRRRSPSSQPGSSWPRIRARRRSRALPRATPGRGARFCAADLGKGWSGGLTKPTLNSRASCSYRPEQSDLVLVGAAESSWYRAGGREIQSEAQTLRTAAMVRRDWRRTVVAPQMLPCLRQAFAKLLGSHVKSLSVRRVAFPRMTTYTGGFRVRAAVESGAGAVPIEIDLVVLGVGRSELSLTLSALGAARASLHAEALHLARVLAHRMHA